jgi:hypothetical protein
MTAVARSLACLLLVFMAIPVATADLQSLASAAHEYRNRLNNLKAVDGDSLKAAATLRQLADGSDPAAAEAQAESMVAAGYGNYVLWTTLKEITSKLGKGLDAVYATYLVTEAVSSEAEKVTDFVALGRELEKVKRGDEAREAYDMPDEHAVGRAYELIAHARSVVERAAPHMELCKNLT